MPFTPRPGDTQNEYGFWQSLDGNLAPGQETPGMRMNPEFQIHYDAERDLDYNIRNGQRVYQSPVSYDMTQDRPTPQYRTSKSGAPITDTGGGMVHSFPHWNPEKGKWDIPLDWSKIGGYAVGAGIGASYIIPALAAAGGAGGAGAGVGAGTLPSTTTIGSSTLGGGMTAGASSGIAAAPSGLLSTAGTVGGVGAGGGAAGAAGTLPSTTAPGSSTLGGSGLSSSGVPGGTSGSGMGGHMSFWDSAKDYYDKYKQGKKIYDQGRQVYDTAHGTPSNNGPSTASALGQTAGSIEQQRMNALIQQARLQQSQDQLAQNRSVLALRAPGQEASNSVRGDILANSRDAEFSGLPSYIHIPQMSGGLRPSMLSDSSRALGANMSRNALANNLSGKDVPDLTPLPEAGKLDTGLQLASGIGSFWDALSHHSMGGGSGGATPPTTDTIGSGYGGEGTPGFPGDNPASPVNNPMPPITSQAPNPDQGGQGIDPEILKWLQDSAQPGAPQ